MKKKNYLFNNNHLKNHLFIIFIYLILFLLIGRNFVQGKILINEFLIEPTPQAVEIINIGTASADISNWYIDDSGGSTYFTIPQNSILYPNSCLVFFSDFNLNKTSADTIRLFNNFAPPTSVNAVLIDSFSYKSSSGSGISYIRLPDGENTWTTASASLGKYNSTGISCIVTPTQTPTPTLTPTKTPTPTLTPTIELSPTLLPTPISYNNIFISEVMIYPTSGQNEWLEIYNNNDFSVSLINWYLDDIEKGGSSPKIFSLEIPAKSYAIFELSSAMFNNNGDSIRLLDFNKNLKDSLEYSSTQQGKSLGRISFSSDEFCLQEPSKGLINNPCINPTPTPLLTSTKSPTITPSPTLSLTPTQFILINQSFQNPQIQSENSKLININPSMNVNSQEEILGISDKISKKKEPSKSLIQSLSFISFSYSLLIIISLILKIKPFF